MRSVLIASALKSALYGEPARHVYRLFKNHVLAVFRYSARDAQALIEFYHWLEYHQSQKAVVLDQAPLVKLSESFAFAEKVDGAIFGRIRRIGRFFLWPCPSGEALAMRMYRVLPPFRSRAKAYHCDLLADALRLARTAARTWSVTYCVWLVEWPIARLLVRVEPPAKE